jgi:hypothetical protein
MGMSYSRSGEDRRKTEEDRREEAAMARAIAIYDAPFRLMMDARADQRAEERRKDRGRRHSDR